MFLSFFNKFILTFNFYYDTFHTTEVVDMKTSYLAKFTKALLDVMLVCGILCTLSLPWLFRFAGEWYPNLRIHYTVHVILFMFSGAGAVSISGSLAGSVAFSSGTGSEGAGSAGASGSSSGFSGSS